MLKITGCFILFVLFVTTKTLAQVNIDTAKYYSVKYTKTDLTKLHNSDNVHIKVYDPQMHDFYSYNLLVNGLILKNNNNSLPFKLSVVAGDSINIKCIAVSYKIAVLPPFNLKKGEMVDIEIYLVDDERPVH